MSKTMPAESVIFHKPKLNFVLSYFLLPLCLAFSFATRSKALYTILSVQLHHHVSSVFLNTDVYFLHKMEKIVLIFLWCLLQVIIHLWFANIIHIDQFFKQLRFPSTTLFFCLLIIHICCYFFSSPRQIFS